MRYLIVEYGTDIIIEEFESNEAREKWVIENCYPNQYMTAYYQITGHGDVKIEFKDDFERQEKREWIKLLSMEQ